MKHIASDFDIAELSGVVPPLVTPLADGNLDLLGLERLVEYVLCADVGGLFVLGTTGEGPALAYDTRRAMVVETIAVVAKRTPVLVGVSDASLAEAVASARFAAESGADAIVATPPFYFPLEQEELAEWYESLSERSPLPVMLYNFPGLAKTAIEPATMARLMQCENIAGIKDSAGEMEVFEQFCRQASQRADWRVFMGPEHLLADAVLIGAHGGVAGGANLEPGLFVEFYEAAANEDLSAVSRIRAKIDTMHQAVYGPVSCKSVICGLKRALANRGICNAESTWERHDISSAARSASS